MALALAHTLGLPDTSALALPNISKLQCISASVLGKAINPLVTPHRDATARHYDTTE